MVQELGPLYGIEPQPVDQAGARRIAPRYSKVIRALEHWEEIHKMSRFQRITDIAMMILLPGTAVALASLAISNYPANPEAVTIFRVAALAGIWTSTLAIPVIIDRHRAQRGENSFSRSLTEEMLAREEEAYIKKPEH